MPSPKPPRRPKPPKEERADPNRPAPDHEAAAEPVARPHVQLGLCLSGGGFRATLFHLGVVEALRDAGLLPNVALVHSVSGGSVLAAHLALNWQAYCEGDFEKEAGKVIDLVQKDVRGRILRRWLLASFVLALVMPLRKLLEPLLRRFHWSQHVWDYLDRQRALGLLESYYWDLYGRETSLAHLPHPLPAAAADDGLDGAASKAAACTATPSPLRPPDLGILGTNVTTATLCIFNHQGYSSGHQDSLAPVAAVAIPVARAVAASSAFPGFFPPLLLTADLLGVTVPLFVPDKQYITDAGVYDNLGVSKVLGTKEEEALDFVLVSDATGVIEWETNKRFTWVLGTAIRTIDVLMLRSRELQQKRIESRPADASPRYVFVRIAQQLPEHEHQYLHPNLQEQLKYIRTDLNAFSLTEVQCLIAHGYEVTRHVLTTSSELRAACPRLKLRLRTVTPFNQPTDNQKHSAAVRQHLYRSRYRPLGLLSARDPVSWFYVTAAACLLWAVALLVRPSSEPTGFEIIPPPQRLREVPAGVARPTHEAFRFWSDHRRVDIRGWKDTPLLFGRKDPYSPVTWYRVLILEKNRPADEIRIEFETSGVRIDPHCSSHSADKWHIETFDRESSTPGRVRRVYQLVLNIADVPEGRKFVISTEATFWNGMNTPNDWDACMVVLGECEEASLLLIFPDHKPFKSCRATIVRLEDRLETGPSSEETRRFIQEGDRRVNWTVFKPRSGYCYRVKWEW